MKKAILIVFVLFCIGSCLPSNDNNQATQTPQNNTSSQNYALDITDVHWIKDNQTSAYLWNPEPGENETITWSGNYIQDGDYRFAEGSGTLTWYKDGEVIQVDEGTFKHGRHNGQFKHTFPSGKVVYSNWNNGTEINPDESVPSTSIANSNPKTEQEKIEKNSQEEYIFCGTQPLLKAKFYLIANTIQYDEATDYLQYNSDEDVIISAEAKAKIVYEKGNPEYVKYVFSKRNNGRVVMEAYREDTGYASNIIEEDPNSVTWKMWQILKNEYIKKLNLNEKEAQQVFINYHKAITEKNYDDAYDMLTRRQQTYIIGGEAYSQIYENTISSTVDNISKVKSEDNTITFNYDIITRDYIEDNRIKVQKFSGQVTMINDNGKWLISNYDVRNKTTKVDEWIENR